LQRQLTILPLTKVAGPRIQSMRGGSALWPSLQGGFVTLPNTKE
jgi:hypothetical protein